MADVDLIGKCITLIGGVIGIGKVCYELFAGHRIRMREEYKFAKDFLKDLDEGKTIHPFLEEKGYQAVAGSTTVSAMEVQYLLSLRNPAKAVDDFVEGRKYLACLDKGTGQGIFFSRTRFEFTWYRRFWKTVYTSLYFICYLAAVLPWLLFSAYFTTSLMLLCFAVFGSYAIASISALTRIVRAERLVHQYLLDANLVERLGASTSSVGKEVLQDFP